VVEVSVSVTVRGPEVGPPVLQTFTMKETGWFAVIPAEAPRMDLVIMMWGVGTGVGQVLVRVKVCR
jgi:hypothetical protein